MAVVQEEPQPMPVVEEEKEPMAVVKQESGVASPVTLREMSPTEKSPSLAIKVNGSANN